MSVIRLLMLLARRVPGGPCGGLAFPIALLLLSSAGCGGGGASVSSVSSGSSVPSRDSTVPVIAATTAPAAAGWAQFTFPTSGQLGIWPSPAFSWTPVPNSQGYQLQVGTSFGASDVFDSGVITTTSIVVPNLPRGGTLYARVRAIPVGWGTALSGNFPRGTYVTFRADNRVTGAQITSPSPGTTLDADEPIVWRADPLARAYRLTIGSVAGGLDLLDTGTIRSPLRVVSGLPAGATVYATLYTYYAASVTRTQSVAFVVGNPSTTASGMLGVARDLGARVRGMADTDNQPLDGTVLADVTGREANAVSDCSAFTTTLLTELADAKLPLQSRELNICLNTNAYDCHALVEVLDPDSQRWVTVDPTFGLYTLNAEGQPATAAEISAAVRSMAFDQLSFEYLTPSGASYAHAYYIDYPLLFLNLYQPGSKTLLQQPPPTSLQPYFDLMGPAVDGAVSGYYAAQCASGYASATSEWDGGSQTYACTDGFTPIFWGISVSVLPGDPSTAAVWRTHRFVF